MTRLRDLYERAVRDHGSHCSGSPCFDLNMLLLKNVCLRISICLWRDCSMV